MKIVRYFNDYYDGVLAHGHDDRLIYVRKTEKKPLPDFLKRQASLLRWCSESRWLNGRLSDFLSTNFAILFCGEIYLGRKLEKSRFSTSPLVANLKTEVFYDKSTLVNRFPVFDTKMTEKEEKKKLRVDAILGRESFSLPDEIRTVPISGLREWSIDQRISIASISYSHPENEVMMTLNPRLADYEFFRVIDPATTFQNLEMWMGGVISQGENNIVNISDKDRVFQHGFDDHSFRKYPEKTRT